jgi:penicillin-binding protein 1A
MLTPAISRGPARNPRRICSSRRPGDRAHQAAFRHNRRSRSRAGPAAQAALLAIDNATGEIKAMVGGYDFDESKFNRATQALRQTGSSFKVYVYADAMAQGASPFDTIVDEPVTFHSGGQDYSPHNYDEKFEGRITLRRALADSRNVPGGAAAGKGRNRERDRSGAPFGITSPLPPYLPLALGAADLTLIEHTSAFTVFPDDGIHIDPHYHSPRHVL